MKTRCYCKAAPRFKRERQRERETEGEGGRERVRERDRQTDRHRETETDGLFFNAQSAMTVSMSREMTPNCP